MATEIAGHADDGVPSQTSDDEREASTEKMFPEGCAFPAHDPRVGRGIDTPPDIETAPEWLRPLLPVRYE